MIYNFDELSPEQKNKLNYILNTYNEHNIPDSFNINACSYNRENISNNHYARYAIIDAVGFTALAKEWVKPLAEFIGNKRVLELGCGLGSLSKSLRDEGIDIIPTDYNPKYRKEWKQKWVEDIENIKAYDAIDKYINDIDIILTSWPDGSISEESVDIDIANYIKDNKCTSFPSIIYIGEGYGGCCASMEFFDVIDGLLTEENNEEIDKINEIYSKYTFDGIHDYISFYK